MPLLCNRQSHVLHPSALPPQLAPPLRPGIPPHDAKPSQPHRNPNRRIAQPHDSRSCQQHEAVAALFCFLAR
jgi:hypothetical protein